MKVAIVHDWLTTWAGAEKALAQLIACYPDAEIFTTVNFLKTEDIPCLTGRTIHTSFIQKLPGARKHYRRYLPLMPLAVEQFDLKGFDLILSSSHAVAKGIIPDPAALHVCYCYSPMRYAWDMQHQYLRQSGNEKGLVGMLMRWQLHRLRQWDYLSAQRVDHFIAISAYIQRRVELFYRRSAEIIYPPVDIEKFNAHRQRSDFYLTAARMVPYKRIDLIIEAFNQMPDKKLVVIGDGPDFAKLNAQAGPNVKLLGYQPDSVLIDHLERAKAFVYMAEEDFGILPVEAQAAGAPVIGYGKGGLAETIVHQQTGLLVEAQSSTALKQGVAQLEQQQQPDSQQRMASLCRQNAQRFANSEFTQAMQNSIATAYSALHSAKNRG
ncbi:MULTISPECIES: glycosyltransferase [unclassified Halomonas]|jgi:glycosyltransferase involved in cell wall biosynthesis|uniref:glycosyltransferase n=1 Tax=Halomonas sp. 707B3 TaxID=1681043 RepID=UPI00209E0DA0|nr:MULTISPECIES: glycosyltransferase [unclassified Halomonas]MCP1317639.1 glycosyltransferase [Halomonas sp. 707B3]